MDKGTQAYLKYLHGDKNALAELVRLYSDGLVRYAYSFLYDSAEAEDVMEDSFAALCSSRKKFSDKQSVKPYLYKIVRNKCIDRLRSYKNKIPLGDVENVLSANVEESAEMRERTEKLYKCLIQLNSEYRAVLQLKYIEGFEVKEICVALKKSEKQVYNLLARAKKEIKNLLIDEGITE